MRRTARADLLYRFVIFHSALVGHMTWCSTGARILLNAGDGARIDDRLKISGDASFSVNTIVKVFL